MSKKRVTVPEDELYDDRPVKRRPGFGRVLLRILAFILATLIIVAAGAYGVMYVIMKGPSPAAKKTFTLSVRETSAIKWLPNLYISDAEIAEIVAEAEAQQDPLEATDASLITITTPEDQNGGGTPGGSSDGIVIEELNSGKFRGYMMLVSDPNRVFVGAPDSYDGGDGTTLMALVEKTGAVAGVNAGGFYDPGGGGNGGTPLGIVINEGKLLYDGGGSYSTMGIDNDGILHVGTMSAAEAQAMDLRCAVSYGPALIVNGEICTGLASGVNPRTAIGQRSDGTILLLVIDGRQIDTLGASYQEVAEVMAEYGAVNAGNLDGGSSTMMIHNGEIINTCASVLGPRKLPTAILVK